MLVVKGLGKIFTPDANEEEKKFNKGRNDGLRLIHFLSEPVSIKVKSLTSLLGMTAGRQS